MVAREGGLEHLEYKNERIDTKERDTTSSAEDKTVFRFRAIGLGQNDRKNVREILLRF